jgi:hypothetical protein
LRRLVRASLVVAALASVAAMAGAEERALELPEGRRIHYTLLDEATRLPSAFATASRVLTHLANGEVEAAARLSNAPERRREVLEDYRARVGDAEFRRIYGRFLEPGNRVTAEIAMGEHRLLVWTLGEASGALVGQFYVEVDGRFVMNDVPGPTRADLRHILRAYQSRSRR